MSYFGNALKNLLQRVGVSSGAIQLDTGIAKASISRWLNGKQTFIKSSDLAKINAAIKQATLQDKAELIAAHLQDELTEAGEGAELIQITLRGKTDAYILHDAGSAKFGSRLSPSDQKTFARLAAKIPGNPAISRNLQNLDELTGEP